MDLYCVQWTHKKTGKTHFGAGDYTKNECQRQCDYLNKDSRNSGDFVINPCLVSHAEQYNIDGVDLRKEYKAKQRRRR